MNNFVIPPPKKPGPKGEPPFTPTREERERFSLSILKEKTIQAALIYADGSRMKASKLLGVDQRTLERWVDGGR